ncbi:hypothetical protein EYS14_18800 [Alteromonadaceae bacterium M269]|nr:hypothetical protein EYS14_18800 [Alteromonadaceae bacterium M269]
MNLYPHFEKQIKNEVIRRSAATVNEVWKGFKNAYKAINLERPSSLKDFGILAEVYFGDDDNPPSFYFALHYRVSFMAGNEESSFYELVYCDFDLSEIPKTLPLKECSIDVCEADNSLEVLFSSIENWPPFMKLKELALPLSIHSEDV